MKNIISYCLWGNCKLYSYNLLENILALPNVFPGWKIIIYYTKTVDNIIIEEYKKFDYVYLQLVDIENGSRNSMLRFIAAFNPSYDHIIFRDADSKLLQRDYVAVNEWINSGKEIHIIRDHPRNGILHRISAGMWGVKNSIFQKYNIKNYFTNYFADPNNNVWRMDEKFLYLYIYPIINENNSIIHSEFNKWESWCQNFPSNAQSRNINFIGQVNNFTPNASKILNDKIEKHHKKRN